MSPGGQILTPDLLMDGYCILHDPLFYLENEEFKKPCLRKMEKARIRWGAADTANCKLTQREL